MTKSLLAFTAVIAMAASAPASAAQYMFQFSGTNLFGNPAMAVGSGIFTTSNVATQVGGHTAYAITSITGMVNGSAIVAPDAPTYGNYFTDGPAFLDGVGLRFFTAANNDIRFFFQDSVGRYRVNTFNPGATGFVTATSSLVAGVPEPATWGLMIMGFGMMGTAVRRSRRTVTANYV